jgi:O-antigen/teichoic acid export membrane protein
MFGPSAAGVYAAAVGLADRLGIIIDSIATASLPTFMRLGKDRERLSSIISQVLSPAVAASLAGAIMALMGSTAAMVVIFGPDYSAGGPLLAIALFGLPILCVSSILFEGLIAVGQVEAASRITLRGQLVGVLCMPIFALVFGISGFPVARLSGNITAAATFLSTSASALPGLRRSARVSSMFASAAWALPVPIILWAEDFGPWATVAFSGGCYLLWVSRYFGIARLREYLKGDQLSGLNPD